jgi:hypothetical protein
VQPALALERGAHRVPVEARPAWRCRAAPAPRPLPSTSGRRRRSRRSGRPAAAPGRPRARASRPARSVLGWPGVRAEGEARCR